MWRIGEDRTLFFLFWQGVQFVMLGTYLSLLLRDHSCWAQGSDPMGFPGLNPGKVLLSHCTFSSVPALCLIRTLVILFSFELDDRVIIMFPFIVLMHIVTAPHHHPRAQVCLPCSLCHLSPLLPSTRTLSNQFNEARPRACHCSIYMSFTTQQTR